MARLLICVVLSAATTSSLIAQAASPRALGPLGPAESWHCAISTDPKPGPAADAVPFAAPVIMTFTLLTPSAPNPVDSTKRMPLRIIIVGYTTAGEPLTISEIVAGSTTDPGIRMPQIRREARGIYSGFLVGGGLLTDAEVASGVELAEELWRRRCAIPRA